MGYTHYWSVKKAPKGKAAQLEKAYQKAILECAKVIRYYSETFGGLSGYSAHVKTSLCVNTLAKMLILSFAKRDSILMIRS